MARNDLRVIIIGCRGVKRSRAAGAADVGAWGSVFPGDRVGWLSGCGGVAVRVAVDPAETAEVEVVLGPGDRDVGETGLGGVDRGG
jgi:hypothetical protein